MAASFLEGSPPRIVTMAARTFWGVRGAWAPFVAMAWRETSSGEDESQWGGDEIGPLASRAAPGASGVRGSGDKRRLPTTSQITLPRGTGTEAREARWRFDVRDRRRVGDRSSALRDGSKRGCLVCGTKVMELPSHMKVTSENAGKRQARPPAPQAVVGCVACAGGGADATLEPRLFFLRG